MNKTYFILASLFFFSQIFPQDQFTEQTSIALTGVIYSSSAWGDYDNDGDLDILLTGYTGAGRVSKIYRNNGDNTFTEQISIALPGVEGGSAAWGDYDNDGDLDILLTGSTNSSYVSKIYRNEGDNTFTEQTGISLIEVYRCSAAWGDYDNDGDLDILLTGFTGSSEVSKIYRNNGNNTFTEQTGISLTGVIGGNATWGDYDSDGDLDILLTGGASSGRVSKIYRNNGDNTFTEQTSISLTAVAGSSAWGDYDNDGDLDILLTGYSSTGRVSKIYRNNGDNTFTETSITLAGVMSSSVAWGDYDNDGDLDILLTGDADGVYISKIYRNNNLIPNTLPAAPSNLSAVINGEDVILSWDKSTDNETSQNGLSYNLVIGTASNAVNKLSPMSDRITGYRRIINLGNTNHRNGWTIKGLDLGQTYYWSVQALDNCFEGSSFFQEQIFKLSDQFTEQTSISLAGVEYSNVAWGDYDNDGDLDILLTGDTGSEAVSKIYRNNEDNTFTEQTGISLIGVYHSSAAWGDYDNDGDLDILLTGDSNSGPVSKIYRNNGDNSFTEQTGISLTGVRLGSVAWGDYDNDGDLDILLTGDTGSEPVSKIYRNDRDNTFTEQSGISLTGVYASSLAWGDYDNDGDLDILLTGSTGSGVVSKIFQNYGNNTFTEHTGVFLTGVTNCSSSWGDYDNDGDLDILLTGWTGSSRTSKIYRNNSFTQNTLPASPLNLTSIDNPDNSVTLSWDKSTDNETPQNGLRYNLVIGTAPNAVNKLSPMSGRETGYRRVIDLGNTNHNNSWTIKGLNSGQTYYWSVQALDNCFAGSNFSQEQNFKAFGQFTEQTSIALTGVYGGSAAWGDYDNDGDLDILLTGNTYPDIISKIYRNNGDNTFTEQTGISLTGVYYSSVAWGDYDNDGDLDILLTGLTGNDAISKIYCNNGNNTFTEQTSIALPGVFHSSVAWGDYDNDGDLDILLTGAGTSYISKIYRNNGDNTFTEQTSIALTGVVGGSAAWGDYDNDGDLDILLTGENYFQADISKIYRNNGDNTFTEQTSIALTGVYYSSVAWGDYDNDGDLDILLTGLTTGGSRVSKIYRNDGDNAFAEQASIALDGVINSSVAWGDYDNDGDLDILLTGATDTGTTSKIYRNNGDNTFTEQTSIALTGVTQSSVVWGDYDNDGDLDILLTGDTGTVRVSKIYRNNNLALNTLPTAPTNLSSMATAESVTLCWDKSTDNETPQNGLRYNIVIGTAPNAVNTLSPMSDRSTGYRRVIELGNTNHNNSWTIKGLDSVQTYYWSVQALDNCFAASGFAQEHSLNITSIEEEQFNGLPTEYELNQNYPNPFNPITVISWQSPVSSWQTMKVYDVLGNEVATLVNEYKSAGRYEVYFNGSGLTSGIYFYKISSGSFVETKKMILLK